MGVHVVLVHGIRTSATMWRAQREYLLDRGHTVAAVDLPGHGTRMAEPFTIEEALATIDRAVRAGDGRRVLLVGHSMGGLVSIAYAGGIPTPPIDGFVAASCTAVPRGAGLAAYRFLAGGFDRLPNHGMAIAERVLDATLPPDTRDDFGAGGYAFAAQDATLAALAALDVTAALARIEVPLWFVNGQFDQLRVSERFFCQIAPQAELIVFPRTSHLVTAMRPAAFNAVLGLAIATIEARPRVGRAS